MKFVTNINSLNKPITLSLQRQWHYLMKLCFQNTLKLNKGFILTSVRTILETILKRIKYNRFLLKIITYYTLLQKKIIKKARKIIVITMKMTLMHQKLMKSLLILINLLASR